MNIYEAVKNRRSVRAYKDKPVPKETLDRILEAGRLAPSANNRQARKFVVVTDAALREKLTQAANNQNFVGQAPVIIAAVDRKSVV